MDTEPIGPHGTSISRLAPAEGVGIPLAIEIRPTDGFFETLSAPMGNGERNGIPLILPW
jgi:hypothetical protein